MNNAKQSTPTNRCNVAFSTESFLGVVVLNNDKQTPAMLRIGSISSIEEFSTKGQTIVSMNNGDRWRVGESVAALSERLRIMHE